MARDKGLRQKLPLGQIALFLGIALACAAYIAVNAVGADTVAPKIHVTAMMDNAGGVNPRSPITYRGVIVGHVDDVLTRPGDAGTEVRMTLLERVKIPVDSQVVVAQDTPVALKHIDLRPPDERPPYLTDGAGVGPKRTSRPVPLETVLVNLMKLTDSLDIDDLTILADELSAGLAGTAPYLERLADNSTELVDEFMELEPTADNLIRSGLDFLESSGGTAERLPHLTRTLAKVTALMRNQTPQALDLAEKVPPFTETIVPLLREQEPSIAVLLANLLTPVQIISARIPALQHGLITIPDGFGALASIVHGDTANFDFVTSQGPTCHFDTSRRVPTDTSSRPPKLTYHCPPGGPVHRGAANAPRPGHEQRPVVTTTDPATGRTEIPGGRPIRLGSNGGQQSLLGGDSWQAIYLQGVQR
ncbi:MAG: MlaD family protein [Haloechinothrix sp.]